MIVELLGIRASGKSTIHRRFVNEFAHNCFYKLVDCRHWDDEIRQGIRNTGFVGNLKGESGFQKNIHHSPWWKTFKYLHRPAIEAYEYAVDQLGGRGEGSVKRLRTGRKYFVRWMRASRSNSICLWDKGLFQVISKLILHDKQYKYLDLDQILPPLIGSWPKSNLYIYLDVDPEVAYERGKKRSGPQWDLETCKESKKIMDRMVGMLEGQKVYLENNTSDPQEAIYEVGHAINRRYLI